MQLETSVCGERASTPVALQSAGAILLRGLVNLGFRRRSLDNAIFGRRLLLAGSWWPSPATLDRGGRCLGGCAACGPGLQRGGLRWGDLGLSAPPLFIHGKNKLPWFVLPGKLRRQRTMRPVTWPSTHEPGNVKPSECPRVVGIERPRLTVFRGIGLKICNRGNINVQTYPIFES